MCPAREHFQHRVQLVGPGAVAIELRLERPSAVDDPGESIREHT